MNLKHDPKKRGIIRDKRYIYIYTSPFDSYVNLVNDIMSQSLFSRDVFHGMSKNFKEKNSQ